MFGHCCGCPAVGIAFLDDGNALILPNLFGHIFCYVWSNSGVPLRGRLHCILGARSQLCLGSLPMGPPQAKCGLAGFVGLCLCDCFCGASAWLRHFSSPAWRYLYSIAQLLGNQCMQCGSPSGMCVASLKYWTMAIPAWLGW